MQSEEQMLGEIHEILQNDRFKAVGKVEAIGEILYGPGGEYADAWADSDEDSEEGEMEEGEED